MTADTEKSNPNATGLDELLNKQPPESGNVSDSSEAQEVALLGSNAFKLAYCVVGILGSFLLYGILQERIMTQKYGGEDGEKFTYTAFLVLNNRAVAVATALFMLYRSGESFKNVAPLLSYFGISFSNVSATYCQYEALKYVSFPTQTLGKCGKMIPVLVLGSLFYGKKYGWKDFAIAACVTIGCAVFVLTGDIGNTNEKVDTSYGLFLMGGYLFLDGFTSTFQEKLFKGYSMSTYNQMLYVNIFSGITSFLILSAQGSLLPAIEFATRYPQMWLQAVGLSLCAVTGQVSIYYTIKEFGALTYSTIMTTRQVISIGLSALIFIHPLTLPQWCAAFLVFGALYYKARMKKPKAAPKDAGASAPQK